MRRETKPKHRPCSCGCGEMADECMTGRGSPLAAFTLDSTDACPCGAQFRHGPHDDCDAVPLGTCENGI